jgi:hypothetical protein
MPSVIEPTNFYERAWHGWWGRRIENISFWVVVVVVVVVVRAQSFKCRDTIGTCLDVTLAESQSLRGTNDALRQNVRLCNLKNKHTVITPETAVSSHWAAVSYADGEEKGTSKKFDGMSRSGTL